VKKKFSTKIFSFRNRVVIIILGFIIGTSSLLFTNNMARQLREKEQNEVKLWSFAMSKMGEMGPENQVLRQIINANTNIPFVITTGTLDVVTSHLIPERILTNPALLRQKCVEMAAINQYWEIKTWSNDTYYLFYGESNLLRTLVYFPYIQLAIICIFAMFGYITFRSSKQDEQNRSGSDWQKRPPTNSARRPRRCSAGSNTCGPNPSTKRPSKR
jgi:two-component system, sporulation sensor kinase D